MTPTPRQFTLDLAAAPLPSLDNFVAGDNGAALAALRAALAGAGPEFIHLWGGSGSGRSHLLAAVVRAEHPSDPPSIDEVPAYTPQRRIYAVDDVHLLDPGQQAALFALQNAVREHGSGRGGSAGPQASAKAPVLVTSADLPPARLQLREDVRTRLGWGLIFALHPIAEADRAAALQAYARARGARVDDELVPYMLTRLPRDMRTLVSVLDALDAYALTQRSALTVRLLRDWLQQQERS